MAQRADSLDLGQMALSSGEGRALSFDVRIDPIELSGQRYAARPEYVPVRLEISRMGGSGYALKLSFTATLEGTCMRCLEPAEVQITVEGREVDQRGGGEELQSPYLEEGVLDLRAWVRDALVLVLPSQIVCQSDCAGLCPACGVNLNQAGTDHRHEEATDSRWAALKDLKFD